MVYKTEQEKFWQGSFGDEYINRNEDNRDLLASDLTLFSEILSRTNNISSVIEFGSNIGINLKAIKTLLPKVKTAAIEINHMAATLLREDIFFQVEMEVFEESILQYQVEKIYDMALIKGVLIHINPDELEQVYEKLYRSAQKYICIAEYYNPSPVEVSYRGNEGKLFKRDFAGEFMEKYSDCRLVDYGFKYHRDSNFPDDDITWFLLEK